MSNCIDCGKDLSEEMGVRVFTFKDDAKGFISGNLATTGHLLCINCGSNGRNTRKRSSLPV